MENAPLNRNKRKLSLCLCDFLLDTYIKLYSGIVLILLTCKCQFDYVFNDIRRELRSVGKSCGSRHCVCSQEFIVFIGLGEWNLVKVEWNTSQDGEVHNLYLPFIWSRVSTGSIVSDYWLDDRASGVRSPAGAKDFSSSLCVQTSSRAHPASCTMGTGG
jgi:hypothetical protein